MGSVNGAKNCKIDGQNDDRVAASNRDVSECLFDTVSISHHKHAWERNNYEESLQKDPEASNTAVVGNLYASVEDSEQWMDRIPESDFVEKGGDDSFVCAVILNGGSGGETEEQGHADTSDLVVAEEGDEGVHVDDV